MLRVTGLGSVARSTADVSWPGPAARRLAPGCSDVQAVLSGVTPPARQRQAMASVQAHRVDREAGLIRLLHPPMVHAEPSAG